MWYTNYFESEGIMILATLSLTLLRHDNLLLFRTMYVGPCFVPRNKTTSCKTRAHAFSTMHDEYGCLKGSLDTIRVYL
jgi:hypothetical protein